MQSYKVLTPLNHNNKSYDPGDVVELEEKLAEALLQGKVVEKTTAKLKESTTKLPAKDDK